MSATIKHIPRAALQSKGDKEHFAQILVQLTFLESQADSAMIEHMYRHLNARSLSLSRKLRSGEKSLAQELESVV